MEFFLAAAIMLCSAASALATDVPSNKDLTGLFGSLVFGAEYTDLGKLVERVYIKVATTGLNMVAVWNKKLSKCGRD